MKYFFSLAILSFFIFASNTASAQSLTEDEQQLVDLVNVSRAQSGLSHLQVDMLLSAVARSHSLDMARNRFFSHESPTTGSMRDRLDTANVPYQRAGENIAFDASVGEAHQAFMNSPHHRENVMSDEYTHIGVGIIRIGNRMMVTQAFMLPRQEAQTEQTAPQAQQPQSETAPTPAAVSSGTQNIQAESNQTEPQPEPTNQISPPPAPVQAIPAPAPQPQIPQAQAPQAQAPQAQAPQAQQQPNVVPPGPGIWIVAPDGQYQRLDLSPETLLQIMSLL